MRTFKLSSLDLLPLPIFVGLVTLLLFVPVLGPPSVSAQVADPETHENLQKAWNAYRHRDYDRARRLLRPFVGERNPHPEVYLLMGRILYAENKFARARDLFQKMIDDVTDPDTRKAVQHLIDRSEGLYRLNLNRREFNHFTILSAAGVAPDMASRVNHHLEEAYQKIGGDMNFFPDERFTVILYPSEEYRRVMKAPVWSGGLFDGKIHLRLLTHRSQPYSKRTVYHEYTHALVYLLARDIVPLWFNEGLATFQEHRQTAGTFRYRYMRTNPPEERLRSLSGLNRMFKQRGDEKSVRLAYEYSHSLMDFLREEYGLPAIKRLLDRTGETSSFKRALNEVFRISKSGLQREWELWVRNSLFR